MGITNIERAHNELAEAIDMAFMTQEYLDEVKGLLEEIGSPRLTEAAELSRDLEKIRDRIYKFKMSL